MLTSKQRAFLRGQANAIEPVFQIGKGEIDEDIVNAVKDCLAKRELIKLKVLENSPYNAREAAEKLAPSANCEIVQVIGSKLTLFKQKKKDSRFDLKKLAVL